MNDDLRDKLAGIIRDESQPLPPPAQPIPTFQNAAHGGININGAHGPVAIHMMPMRRESRFQRRLRHFRWRTRWLAASIAICVSLSYLLFFYLSVSPYVEVGYNLIEALRASNTAGNSFPMLLAKAFILGVPAGLVVFSTYLTLTWNGDAPERDA